MHVQIKIFTSEMKNRLITRHDTASRENQKERKKSKDDEGNLSLLDGIILLAGALAHLLNVSGTSDNGFQDGFGDGSINNGGDTLSGVESDHDAKTVELAHNQLRDQVPRKSGKGEVEDQVDKSDASGEGGSLHGEADETVSLADDGRVGRTLFNSEEMEDEDESDEDIDSCGNREPKSDGDGDVGNEGEALNTLEFDAGRKTRGERSEDTDNTETKNDVALGSSPASLEEELLRERSEDSSDKDFIV